MKTLERDRMPLEAATAELLKAKTNRERKKFAAERWVIWVPDTLIDEAKAEERWQKKHSRRCAAAKLVQLGKWLRRAKTRRQRLQGTYAELIQTREKLEKDRAEAEEKEFSMQVRVLDQQLNTLELSRKALDFHAKVLDLAWENIENECKKRGVKL